MSSWVLVCRSVPDEGSVSEDRIAPPSPEDRDSGLFMLKKDSERRAILFKVLNEDQAKVISNLRENYIQVCMVKVFTIYSPKTPMKWLPPPPVKYNPKNEIIVIFTNHKHIS